MRPVTITIIDYGMGNLVSVSNALSALHVPHSISNRAADIDAADALILPGVGAFGAAMENLRRLQVIDTLRRNVVDKGKPVLGICLGMQLFAETSEEKGHFEGLGWIRGNVRALRPGPTVRIPHVGWTEIVRQRGDCLYGRLGEHPSFYFDHSFHLECPLDLVTAKFCHGGEFVAAIRKDNLFGVQFHPEKSHRNGLKLLRNFVNQATALQGNLQHA